MSKWLNEQGVSDWMSKGWVALVKICCRQVPVLSCRGLAKDDSRTPGRESENQHNRGGAQQQFWECFGWPASRGASSGWVDDGLCVCSVVCSCTLRAYLCVCVCVCICVCMCVWVCMCVHMCVYAHCYCYVYCFCISVLLNCWCFIVNCIECFM